MSWCVVAVAVTAVAAGLLVWWATGPWGPGLSPDAIAYSATAERIRDHAELGYWLEPRMSSWPPLFPLLLAGVSALFGSTSVEAGRLINAVIQCATVVVVALLAWRLLRSMWLRALAVLTAAIAQPLVFVAVKVWSEPLFNLFVLLAALALAGVPGRRGSLRLLGASALVIGAFTTRYAGLAFVPAGILVVGLWPRISPGRERIVRAAWFGVPAILAACSLVLWNRARTGHAFGPRWQPDEPFWHHGADGLVAIGQWFLPADSARGLAMACGVVLFVAVGVTVVAAWSRRTPNEIGDHAPPIGVAPVLALFVVCYFAYMVWARTSSGFDPLNGRLMLPILVPGVLLVLALTERWADTRPEGISRALVLALPLLILVPVLSRGLDELRTSHDVGNEYTNAAVREFVGRPILQSVPRDCQLLTNDPWLLWLAGFEAQLSPESDRQVAIPQSMPLDELAPMVATRDVCLVWMDTGSSVFFDPDELTDVVRLDELASDGFTTIYRLGGRG